MHESHKHIKISTRQRKCHKCQMHLQLTHSTPTPAGEFSHRSALTLTHTHTHALPLSLMVSSELLPVANRSNISAVFPPPRGDWVENLTSTPLQILYKLG